MTPTDQSRLHHLGVSVRELARLIGKPPSTVQGWGGTRSGRGVQQTPPEIGLLLDAWTMCPEALERARTHMAAETGVYARK